MNAQQAENLRILIRHMETKVTRTLNMDSYHRCGTPACAIGEAATLSHFRALGLELEGEHALRYRSGNADLGAYALFGFGQETNWRMFGLSDANAWKRTHVTPQEWAAEARKVLAENGYSMDDDNTWARDKVAALCVVDPAPAWDHA